MDKRLSLQLNGSRRVTGILRGYDPFMNVVLDDTIEEVSATEKHNIGMVVSNSVPTLVQPWPIVLILIATLFFFFHRSFVVTALSSWKRWSVSHKRFNIKINALML
jgi:small nuclear ribonucleoprotein (snRNP)-like protein